MDSLMSGPKLGTDYRDSILRDVLRGGPAWETFTGETIDLFVAAVTPKEKESCVQEAFGGKASERDRAATLQGLRASLDSSCCSQEYGVSAGREEGCKERAGSGK